MRSSIFGTAYFGDKGLTAMGLNMAWAADVQLFFIGTMAHAFKVCEEVKENLNAHLLDSSDFAGLQAHLNPVRVRR